MPLEFQIEVLCLFLVVFAFYPNRRHLRSFQARFDRLARRKTLVIFLTGLAAFLISAAYAWRAGMPVPYVHDEFAYLLGADTFAHGRLTNPTPPLWPHFETYYEILRPTYQSKYPPAQSLFLAAGQLIARAPIAGVWLSLALAMSALAWMLQAWLRPRWALVAALLAVLHIRIFFEWGYTYWGGAVAMLGGALLLGALPRWCARPDVRHAVLAAAGVALLANSRPYEGLVLTVTAGLVFLFSDGGPRRFPASAWLKTVPALALLAANLAWMGYYNYRITGKATTMPYQAWSAQYTPDGLNTTLNLFPRQGQPASRPLLFLSPAQESHRAQLERLALSTVRDPHDPFQKLAHLGDFYLGVFLGLPAAIALATLSNRRTRRALFLIAPVLLAVLLQNTQGHPHYFAPAASLVFVLAGKGLQRLAAIRSVKIIDLHHLNFAFLSACAASMLLFCLIFTWHAWTEEKWAVVDQLHAAGDRHIVIVQYGPTHSFHHEWVYNDADIDAQSVIWARDLGAGRNQELFPYYPDRTIWTLDADATPPVLTKLRAPRAAESSAAPLLPTRGPG